MKTVEAVAKSYLGVLIFETMSGFTVFGENDQQYDFASRSEAEAFIDAWILTKMEMETVGTMPIQ